MATHYRCDPLSDQQVIEYATALRHHHGVGAAEVPDVMAVLGHATIQTRNGLKEFRYRVVADEELGDDEAVTNISAREVEVVLSETTHSHANFGDGRARMTIAHELAHAVLHRNTAALARSRVDRGHSFQKPYEDVEHQAKVFASHYLIAEAAVIESNTVEELAERCFVSLQAAKIRWQKALERANRARVQAKLLALGDELRSGSRQGTPNGSTSVCTTCGQPTLKDAGNKSYCSTCQRMGDAHADGDGLA